MAYPAYLQSEDSTVETVDNLQVDRATNGLLRGRATYSAPKKRFLIRHRRLTVAEADAIDTYYAAHRTEAFDFVWAKDGATYSVMFTQPPRQACWEGLLWDVDVGLET